MLANTNLNFYDGKLNTYREIGKKRIQSGDLRPQHSQYSQSAPATRYPLRMARSFNDSPNVVTSKGCLTSKSHSNTLQLNLIYDKHAQFKRNCENFEIFVNECKKRRELQSNFHDCNNTSWTQVQYFGNRNEGIESCTISSNNSEHHKLVRSLLSSSHLIRNATGQSNENAKKKAMRGYSVSPMRTARSLGKTNSTREFASRFSSNSKPPRSIRLHASEPSSFFEIESEDSSDLAEESPILYNDIQATITTPHHPPFLLQTGNNQNGHLKSSIFFSQNNTSLTRTDYFQEYMEERIARWRPGNSQFNVEATMEGKHPYQQEHFEFEAKAAKMRPYNPFMALKTWFNGKGAIPDLENQTQSISHSNTHKKTNELTQDTLGIQLPEISERLRKIEFKVNSSNSIIPKPYKPGECSHIAKGLRDTSTKQESTPIDGPTYTPKALPFSDYDLNFETKDCFSSHKTEHGSNAIIDSMDEDIRDLLNGFDNFLADCFRSFWNACSSTGKMCFNPT